MHVFCYIYDYTSLVLCAIGSVEDCQALFCGLDVSLLAVFIIRPTNSLHDVIYAQNNTMQYLQHSIVGFFRCYRPIYMTALQTKVL